MFTKAIQKIFYFLCIFTVLVLFGCKGKDGTNGTNGTNGANGEDAPTVVSADSTACYTAADTFYIAFNSAVSPQPASFCTPIYYLLWECYGSQSDCTNQTNRVCGSSSDSIDLGNGTAWTASQLDAEATNGGCGVKTISYCRLGCD